MSEKGVGGRRLEAGREEGKERRGGNEPTNNI